MAKTAKRKKKRTSSNRSRQPAFSWPALAAALLALVSLGGWGWAGQLLRSGSQWLTGDLWWILNLFILAFSTVWMINRTIVKQFPVRWTGGALLFLGVLLFTEVRWASGFNDPAISVFMETFGRDGWLDRSGAASIGGGTIGALIYDAVHFLIGTAGAYIVSVLLMIAGLFLLMQWSFQHTMQTGGAWVARASKQGAAQAVEKGKQRRAERKKQKEARGKETPAQAAPKQKETPEAPVEKSKEGAEKPKIFSFTEQAYQEPPAAKEAPKPEEPVRKKEAPATEAVEAPAESGPDVDRSDMLSVTEGETENKNYQLPALTMLSAPKNQNQQQERSQISANAKKLEETLQSFGVKANVSEVHLGPAVTKYEIQPAVGVKVSKIVNLSDDIALALAARDIRIEAPIPGKSAVGIEVPNQEVAMVTLREVLESLEKKDDHVLDVALGRDISGEPILASLHKMPHLLVAGATGSGKSVCINGIITSILMRARPHEVKLLMIDPKMVELNVYNGIPHLMAPVVTEPKKAAQALKKVVAEMERRYDLFSHTGTRNLEGYNEWIRKQNDKGGAKQPELPYIVVIVDELADLMMVASSEVEDAITRLAQMARAAGIHMIIATQRPSVDVITGVIKANIPSRIAFGVSSQTDSRTILDSGGAEKLVGKGDMLFSPIGSNKSTRVQGAFVSDHEVEQVVEAVVAQQKAKYQEEMIPDEQPAQAERPSDELFDEAVDMILQMQSASVSMLQRRFRIGYTRAARLIDEMEDRGIVGPYGGSKPREVLGDTRGGSGEPAEEKEDTHHS
ncbi:FtsK/SpoIIIE family DNA translocase [Marinococcus luteus]|uniref:FtsK/SpoIIIE family DNA translocase n=1 Tax=Marinococcus luteus TaxID=1122204 RepID=UPI002ACD195C|nr:DNA translocase FtsK [Marinococcus luteus]MDZ5781860.1 DNA translocase FtsK [Marinococcus luteus]